MEEDFKVLSGSPIPVCGRGKDSWLGAGSVSEGRTHEILPLSLVVDGYHPYLDVGFSQEKEAAVWTWTWTPKVENRLCILTWLRLLTHPKHSTP